MLPTRLGSNSASSWIDLNFCNGSCFNLSKDIQGTNVLEQPFYPFWAVNILNKGATKRASCLTMIWTQEGLFQFLQGSCCSLANDAGQNCAGSPFGLWTLVWIKCCQKANSLKRIWSQPSPSSGRFISTFAIDPVVILASDAEQHLCWCSNFYLFWWWEFWIKVLLKSKLPEDDLKTTLIWSQPCSFRKAHFNFCKCWIKMLLKGKLLGCKMTWTQPCTTSPEMCISKMFSMEPGRIWQMSNKMLE